MKPRRLVRATTFSISWSRGIVKTYPIPPPGRRKRRPTSPASGEETFSPFFQEGEEVSGRVLEPRYVWALACGNAASNTFLVGQFFVLLELDAFTCRFR